MQASRIHINGTTKLYFMHYLCEVIILFITDLCNLHFLPILLKELFFSVFCVFCLIRLNSNFLFYVTTL